MNKFEVNQSVWDEYNNIYALGKILFWLDHVLDQVLCVDLRRKFTWLRSHEILAHDFEDSFQSLQ